MSALLELALSYKIGVIDPKSFFLLHEGIGDFLAAVEGRDDDEKGAASDDEAKLAVADVAFFVCAGLEERMRRTLKDRTSGGFLDLVEDQVHELVVALERANDYVVSVPWLRFSANCFKLTFPAAAELDAQLLVHVLAQVEDVFLLGAFGLAACAGGMSAASSPTTATIAATGTTAATSECAALRHVEWA